MTVVQRKSLDGWNMISKATSAAWERKRRPKKRGGFLGKKESNPVTRGVKKRKRKTRSNDCGVFSNRRTGVVKRGRQKKSKDPFT